jgi:primosomal protein N' (replication factor Y)
MSSFARISVNIAQVSGVFDYSIPEPLQSLVQIGSLVQVPFGKQLVQGIVISLPAEAVVAETRPVEAVIESDPVVTPQQITLAEELAKRNFATTSAFLDLMVPPGLSQHADVLIHLVQSSSEGLSTPILQRIVALLDKRGDLRGSQLSTAMPTIDWRSAVNSLARQNLITLTPFLPPPSVRPKIIRTALFQANVSSSEEGLSILGRRAELRARRKRVLDFLEGEALPIAVTWVYAETGANGGDLEKLSSMGLIQLGETEVWRDPLVNMQPVLTSAPELTADQQSVLSVIQPQFTGKEILKPILIHGVTGSGKTEIYMKAVEETLARGKGVFILVPEIALTPQMARRFYARFPGKVGLIHSRLSPGERYDTWRRIRSGDLPIVIGPRSALFSPLLEPGLIVIDECHDHSYHQEDNPPQYHTVAAAMVYAQQTGAVLLLGSATPGIELLAQFQQQKWPVLSLPKRIAASLPGESVISQESPPLPIIEVVDMRAELRKGNRTALSESLQVEIGNVLDRKEQVILFLNRRGSASYVFCRDCGMVLRCSRCNTPYTWHAGNALLICHSCNHQRQMPKTCPACSSNNIRQFGMGTESLEKLVLEVFPTARTLRWDADTARYKGAHDLILDHFTQHRADILIGTQMLAKGLDLPLVTLVGIILADLSLHLPDFRAPERTFQLITQVAGRSGRSSLGGKTILQTFEPENYAIQCAAKYDFDQFLKTELEHRRKLQYPPYSRLIRVELRHPKAELVQKQALLAREMLTGWIEEEDLRQTEIIGPAPCYYEKRAGLYRWQMLLRGSNPARLLEAHPPSEWNLGGVMIQVTVDPTTVL